MRKFQISALLFLTLSLMISCSNDDGGDQGPGTGELILQAIVGDWTATSAVFTTIVANPEQTRDVVDDGGLCDLSVFPNRSFSLVIRNPGVPGPQITTGVFTASGNSITVTLDSNPGVAVPWEFTVFGDELTITGPVDYDFENDGVFEQTSAEMRFMPD